MEFDSWFCETQFGVLEGLITNQMGRHLMESGTFAYVYGHRLLNKHVKRERWRLEASNPGIRKKNPLHFSVLRKPCINGIKYQRRCHKLTLGLATEKLRELKTRLASGGSDQYGHELVVVSDEGELEIHYQEPPESYFGKFKRNWALHFGFLILIYSFMVSSSVVLLCY
ncbi:hypothetical protein H0E87_001149 [Populus deltoides]|uniref:Uncharacterized protein n=1 Tax=Populus deltoides TaxID=3696 RepID=A0A8T2ZS76_POPDE|nr:hypothetical protein H0E87_001149 [Populus deltoides]